MSEKKWSRRKLLIIPVVVAVLSLAAAGVVVAQSAPAPTTSKQCYSKPCYGNANKETVYERIGDGVPDTMAAVGNDDRLHANTYSKDTDTLYSNAGNDFVYVDDGDTKDSANGGEGNDWCYVDAETEAANTCEKVIVR